MTTSDEDWDPDEDWEDDDAPVDVVRCPSCGAEIYEDAEQCPECGDYVIHGNSAPWQGKPGWYAALAVLGILAVLLVLSGLANWL